MCIKPRRPVAAMEARLKNRRVAGFLLPDGTIQYRFKRLSSNRDVVLDGIRVSPEAVAAMYSIALRLQADNPTVQYRERGG